jgi:serine/threonine protein kinase
MERMDGDLADVFDELETKSKNCNESLRFWALCCREAAHMLNRLHEVGVYHLDTKPGNLLIRRTPGVGRGFQLRFIDFGLGAYLPRAAGEPQMECRATGTFLPPEWRRNGDKYKPTFEHLTRHDQIEVGEAYALCKTCLDMRQSLHSSVRNGSLSKKLPAFRALVAALEAGQKDSDGAAARMRACGGGVRGIEAMAESAVRELDSVLSSDAEEEMVKAKFPMF